MRRLLLAAFAAFTAPALAQEAPPASAQLRFPQLSTEIDMSMIGVGTTRATDPAREGTSVFLFGDISMGLSLTENFSIQATFATEPIGEGDSTGGFPDGGLIGFRRQAVFIEQIYADWKPVEELHLLGGILIAPFARGYHDAPGILAPIRSHEIALIEQVLGGQTTYTWLDDPRFGQHDISAAVFTLDRTALTGTYLTPRSCCNERYERYNRNTAAQGGPGNNGTFNNGAIALDGDQMPWLPGLSYHLAVLSQAPGSDGTAREWGYAATLQYLHRWNAGHATTLFAEGVQFRNAGGRPRVAVTTAGTDPDTGEAVDSSTDTTLAARETFLTLGVQHRMGAWRATASWQQLQQKRSLDPVPNQNWFEVSVGRQIGWGFSLDVGYQYAQELVDEDSNRRGTAHAVLARLRYQGDF